MTDTTHICPCGSHRWPGEIVSRLGNLIEVAVDAPNGVFTEYRRAAYDGTTCEEELLWYYRT